MTEPRRQSVSQTVRAMVQGLFPGDVMQLMLAGQAVLFHALTIDAAGDVEREYEETPKARARSIVANLSRTTTKNLDTLVRLRTDCAKLVSTPATGPVASDLDETIPPLPLDVDADGSCEAGRENAECGAVDPIANLSDGAADATEADLAERGSMEAMLHRLFAGDAVPETPAAPLNRQQRRRQEREQARLARRTPAVVNEGRQ